ncbi:MAG: peroxiredoxin family protein, partial [Candidatus Poseidoniales archaeon]
MENTLDFSILKDSDTWKSFSIALILFSIIGYSSLSLFGISTSAYGLSDDIRTTPDFLVPTMNRTGIDNLADVDSDGVLKLSDLRGKIVILDFMAIECSNCHLVQEHIDQNLDEWNNLEGEYPIIVLSIASWYAIESFEDINST